MDWIGLAPTEQFNRSSTYSCLCLWLLGLRIYVLDLKSVKFPNKSSHLPPTWILQERTLSRTILSIHMNYPFNQLKLSTMYRHIDIQSQKTRAWRNVVVFYTEREMGMGIEHSPLRIAVHSQWHSVTLFWLGSVATATNRRTVPYYYILNSR